MGTAKTIISVAIIGNAKNLVGAVNKADASLGGFLKGAAKGFIAFKAVDEASDFIGDSLSESDRLGDALARLNAQVGPDFTANLRESADQFIRIGASSQDILELEAIFADFGTTAGILDATMVELAPSVAATATALSLVDDQGRDANTILDLIDKSAAGSEKSARELGVTLIKGADATTQLKNILEQLKPKLDDATSGTADLEQKQREMGARVEELQGKLGQQLEPALVSVFTVITDGIDDIDGAIWGFQQLGHQIDIFGRDAVGPLARVRESLEDILNLLGVINTKELKFTGGPLGRNETNTTKDTRDRNERNGVVNGRIGGLGN